VRQLLEYIIDSDPRLHVVGSVPSAEEALKVLGRLSPNVISLDIRLPGMNGLEATRRIMREKPTPIVVCAASVESEDLKITMNALRSGALAVVEKPVGTTRADYDRIAKNLCTQLAIMSEVKLIRQTSFAEPRPFSVAPVPVSAPSRPPRYVFPRRPFQVVGIGASTGGPNAVVQVLTDLGRSFPTPILLVQHIMPAFQGGFVTWLENVTPFKVVVGRHGEALVPGTVYVAPPDFHLGLLGDRIHLTQDSPISNQRPSATVMFQSIARSVGARALGILLTGMGDDGADGLVEMRQAGGYTIAEDESTAVVYGMPKAAVDRGAVCESLPLTEIASRVLELTSTGQEV
jgi:two-component system chemotaxis response regulator CheB